MKESQAQIDHKFKLLSEHEKILIRPAHYLGSVESSTELQWTLENCKMVNKEITFNYAVLKSFDEILSNSCDHAKTPEGKHLNEIKVEIDKDTGLISVFDNGGIPVIKHSDHNMYIPEMIFGHLHAGSNFNDDEDSTTIGQNGVGSTLTNIFATKFTVETADGASMFVQTYTNNMFDKTKPKITKSKRKFTRISWISDKKYMKTDINDLDNYNKIIKRIYEAAACNHKIKFTINGKSIKFTDGFYDYARMFADDVITCGNDDYQVGFTNSQRGDFEHVSYVNGTESFVGGTHIDYLMDQVTTQIRTHIKKKHKIDIMPNQIRNHFMLFANVTIVNPRFSSQTKEKLVTNVSDFKTSFTIPDKTIKEIIKSPIMESIIRWVEAKSLADNNKALMSAQKKLAKRDVEKYVAAAGEESTDKPNSITKFLFLTEGDSAIGNFVNCRDYKAHGGYPMRGKVLNSRTSAYTKILANNECADIMSILELELGAPVTHKLPYDYIVAMTDADVDGACICGQLINFFSMWPELFEQGRILRLMTPLFIINQGKNKKSLWFYSKPEYDVWLESNDTPSPKNVKYIKGLGELDEDEYHKCLNEPVFQRFTLNDAGNNALEMAFGDDAAPRKTWLMNK